MNNRWQMNRMGFVSFWLYDVETFHFADGKLFLRGANASGKSITTQSFIPFILDGDRAPSRLDPFGSTDRKMEYYFLGNGDKDDVTGYLFLEFKKGDTNQYRTIGIGQRAQKGKQMAFWGFIILDGKRIGEDLNLYKEVGSRNIAYSKQELRKILGEDNILVDSHKDYMELVNKYVFGFPRIEQYDQFIRLMIKVRAPKLSRDFKPTKVYEILNESLQTLSDEDLRAMVDAMEKMDDIQGRLDSLKEAFKDLSSIRNEYERYNRYMLSKKANAYWEVKKEVESSRDKLDIYINEVKDKQEENCIKKKENEQLSQEVEVLKKEKEILASTDLEGEVDKLNNRNEKKDQLEAESKKLVLKIESHRAEVRQYDINLREYKNSVENHQAKIKKMIKELDEINEILQFNKHNLVKRVIEKSDNKSEFISFNEELKEYEGAIKNGLKALLELRIIEEKLNILEEEMNRLNFNKGNYEEQVKEVESIERQCRDSIVEEFHILSEKYKELIIEKQELNKLISYVINYRNSKDYGEIKNVIDKVHVYRSRKLLESQVKTFKYREDLAIRYHKAVEELNELKIMKEPIPERRDSVTKSRKILLEKGIKYLSFYEEVEFNDKLTEEEQSVLEEQLMNSGLLDALVVADKDYEIAKKELNYLSDTLIAANPDIHSGFKKLVPGELDLELRKSVEKILDNISEKNIENSTLVLSDDGYFKNGIIEGHSIAKGKAYFVGSLARRRRMLQLIEEKEVECSLLESNLNECDLQLEKIQDSIEILNKEYEGIPKFDDLDEAIEMLREAEYVLKKTCEECKKKEEELDNVTNKSKQVKQNVINSCKDLPYSRKVEEYEEAMESVDEYKEQVRDLEREINYLNTAKLHCSRIEDLIGKEEEAIDDTDLNLNRVNREINVYKAEIKKIEEFLNSPENIEIARKLESIKKDLEEKMKKTIDNGTYIAVLDSEITGKQKEIGELKIKIIDIIKREEKLRKYYQEELELGLILKQGNKSIDECTVEAMACIRENDKNKSIGDIVAALHRIYQQHNSSLTSYGTSLEDYFEDDEKDSNLLRKRQCIVSTWQSKKLYLEEFYLVLKEAIESTDLLIKVKDRELFENILADTISRKLSNRITESKRWIKDMSNLMLEMDTSMGMAFSLDWKPRFAEGEKELDTQELEKLLSRDKELLTTEDIEKVSAHFRSKIKLAKQSAEDNGDVINYSDLVREALDYRQWFEFKMHFVKSGDPKKELTNSAFNKFSGGEKAMAMYVPLFAAVNAQYRKSENPDHPRIIALDEAFAGVDDKNISSMFELVQKLEFGYIMNSQALWGCYSTVKSLRIAELLRPANSSVVTVIPYYWNGKERTLDEQ